MATPHKATWTAIRIRGKRHGDQAEKVRKRRRRLEMRKPRTGTDHVSSTSSEVSSSRPRKRRRKTDEVPSPLEKLPTEVVQQIFEYSANIALPLVSRQLALKLSNSSHLQIQLTTLLLRPILGHENESAAGATDLANAARLLNCRFVTWHFFSSWLRCQPEASSMSIAPVSEDWTRLWSALRPAPGLLPPKKLLCAPFTQDKATFLSVLTYNLNDITSINPTYGELAQEGLASAVQQGDVIMVALLLGLGLQGSTELLQSAVIDADCNEDIVRMIVGPLGHSDRMRDTSSNAKYRNAGWPVDLLDPAVWSWASRAKRCGNGKGEWLLTFLKDAQQRQGSDRDIKIE